MISRQPAEDPQYETRGIPLTQADMRKAAHDGYWGKKLEGAGFGDPIVDKALSSEEVNAAVAIIFSSLPRTRVTQEVTKLLTIPPRPEIKGSRELNCQILFRPTQTANQLGVVEVRLISAPATKLEDSSSTFPGHQVNQHEFSPKAHTFTAHNFPLDPANYWNNNHEEYLRVTYWIENSAHTKFDQRLTIKLGDKITSFQITGAKDPSSGIAKADIYYLGPGINSQPPTGHDSHDFADKDIEDLQNSPDLTHHDKLGRINGLDKLAPEERAPVKVAILQYFKSDPTHVDPNDPRKLQPKIGLRNAEVDAIVPIPDPPLGMATPANTNRRVLVTLRFRPRTNDVDVEWIGELTKDNNVERVGEKNKTISLSQGSLDRVNGFLAHTQGATEAAKVASLLDWLKTRYQGITLTDTTTVDAVKKEVNAQILAGSRTPDWYQKNYGITVLDSGKSEAWLKKIDHTCLQDLKPFDTSELQILEMVLEKMSDEVLARLKGVYLARQNVYFKGSPSTRTNKNCKGVSGFEEQPHIAGITRGDASAPIITIFDAAWANVDSLFVGGRSVDSAGKPSKLDVEAASAQTFAHELGHVASYGPNVRKEFDKLVKEKNIKPMTWVAAEDTDPPKELFAEAFALYYSDPQWLRDNSSDLYKFFDELDKKPFSKGNTAAPQSAPGKH